MKRFMTGEWKVRAGGVLLAVPMAAGMTACGSKSGDNGSTQGTVQESVQTQTDGVEKIIVHKSVIRINIVHINVNIFIKVKCGNL